MYNLESRTVSMAYWFHWCNELTKDLLSILCSCVGKKKVRELLQSYKIMMGVILSICTIRKMAEQGH